MTTPDHTPERVAEIDRLSVAVYWPNEGYGSAAYCQNEEVAEAEAAKLHRLGYGAGDTEIHIIRERREVTTWQPRPQEPRA